MSKGLEELGRLKQYWNNEIPLSHRDGLKIVSNIEKELKDYEWLKSKINTDFFYQLPSEDRVKLAEILGVKL